MGLCNYLLKLEESKTNLSIAISLEPTMETINNMESTLRKGTELRECVKIKTFSILEDEKHTHALLNIESRKRLQKYKYKKNRKQVPEEGYN